MVFEITLDDEIYYCKRMSAVNQFHASSLLGNSKLLYLAFDKKNIDVMINALISAIEFDKAKEIAELLTQNVQTKDINGDLQTVSIMDFSEDITLYWRLVAELIYANFSKLSNYLQQEGQKRKKPTTKRKKSA